MDAVIWLPALTGVMGVGVGAALQYYSTRAVERGRHFEELRSRAYVDFIRATTAIAIAGRDQDSETATSALAELADAKVRVALYGSAEVVKSLAAFCRTTQHLGSPEAKQSFVTLALAMRADAEISVTDLTTIFFEG